MLAVLPDRCALCTRASCSGHRVLHPVKQAPSSRLHGPHTRLGPMPGTRAQALAPAQPAERDSEPAIPMVAEGAANDPQEGADEPQPEQDQGAGVIGRATRSLTGFLAGRGGTPAPVGGACCHRRSRGWLVSWSGEGGTGRPLPARSSAGRPPSVASAAIGAVYGLVRATLEWGGMEAVQPTHTVQRG